MLETVRVNETNKDTDVTVILIRSTKANFKD